jgi:RNA polymerase primary sigma factor
MEMPLEKVRRILRIAKEPISLETPVGDGEDTNIGDFIADSESVSPIEAVRRLNVQVRKALFWPAPA